MLLCLVLLPQLRNNTKDLMISPYDQLSSCSLPQTKHLYFFVSFLFMCAWSCCYKCICDVDAHMFTWMWRPEVNFVVLQEQPILFLETVSLTGPRSNGVVEADWQPYSSRYPPFCVFPLLWWQVIATNSGPHAHSRNTGPTKLSP